MIVDLTHPCHPQAPLLDQHAADLLEQGEPLPNPHDRLVRLGQRGVDASKTLRSPLREHTAGHIATAHDQTIAIGNDSDVVMTRAGDPAEHRAQLKPIVRERLASLDHLPVQLKDPVRSQLRKQLQQTTSELVLGGDLTEVARRSIEELGTQVNNPPRAVAHRAVDRERVKLGIDRGAQPLLALTHRPLDPRALGHLARTHGDTLAPPDHAVHNPAAADRRAAA